MRIRILGSSAGGGLPQWNCRCANCAAVRAGSPDIAPRTQSSLAVSADGHAWFLLNVSPDVRQQILAFPELGPAPDCVTPQITASSSLPRASDERADPLSARTEKRNPYEQRALRGTAIAACILTDAELDHTTGLLLLREQGRHRIFGSATVRRWLGRDFPVQKILAAFHDPAWGDLPLDVPLELPLPDGTPSGLKVRAFEVDRHVPRYVAEDASASAGAVVGLHLQDVKTGGRLLYAPCLPALNAPLRAAADDADGVLIDGTFWSDDEPIRHGIGDRTARAMGHLPVGGPDGSLGWLGTLQVRQRAYLHINNTNPMLNTRGPEHAEVSARGVRVAEDGDEFDL